MPRPAKSKARPKAYSYTRFSRPEQRKGESSRRQIEQARDYADDNDLKLDETLRDEGVSAYRGRHRDEKAALGAFLRRVEAGEIARGSYLLVESLDRLSREEVLDALELFLGLTRAGIVIVTLADGRRYSRESMREDYTQLLISNVMMSRAHEESATKGVRVADAWAKKRERAQRDRQAMTARAPGWIRLVGGPRTGRYEPIPERAEIVRKIFSQTINGMGHRAIAQGLNKAKEETWGTGKRKGEFWHASYIRKILTNPATYGTFTPNARTAALFGRQADAPIEGYFPAVIDEETFWRAQTASKLRGSGQGKTGRRKNLLNGLVKCQFCGGSMVYIEKGARSSGPKLKCGRAHAAAGCDHRALYRYDRIELGIIIGLGDLRASLVQAASNRSVELEQLRVGAELKRDAIAKRLENLIELVAAGGSGPTVAAQVAALEQQKNAADREVDRLKREAKTVQANETAAALSSLKDAYAAVVATSASDDASERAAIQQRLKLLIDRIEIGPSGFNAFHKGGTQSKMFFAQARG